MSRLRSLSAPSGTFDTVSPAVKPQTGWLSPAFLSDLSTSAPCRICSTQLLLWLMTSSRYIGCTLGTVGDVGMWLGHQTAWKEAWQIGTTLSIRQFSLLHQLHLYLNPSILSCHSDGALGEYYKQHHLGNYTPGNTSLILIAPKACSYVTVDKADHVGSY